MLPAKSCCPQIKCRRQSLRPPTRYLVGSQPHLLQFSLGKSGDKPLGGYPGGVRKRFGTFEVFCSRKQHEHLKTLADYVINQQYYHLRDAGDAYAQFFNEVVERTACLIAQWQTMRLGALGQASGRQLFRLRRASSPSLPYCDTVIR